VRKRSANTIWVAKQLARLAGVHPRDIGYAGLKDRDAIALQSFTVPLRSKVGEQWLGVAGEGFEVIGASRHRRKLKRGALRGNGFTIVLRDFRGDRAALDARLQRVATDGVPNYFGPQRFGRNGHNIQTALRWFESNQPPSDRFERSFAISAARSALFNAVLAERVRTGTWNQIIEGDIANLDGSGSVFGVDEPDAVLERRCAILDIHPTGPLWHGESSAKAAVHELEQRIAADSMALAQGLAQVGLEAERRPLRARVSDLSWSVNPSSREHDASAAKVSDPEAPDGDVVTVRFRLGRGTFATAVLHEVLHDVFGQDFPDGD
jgi:tRNA pseudouridine13 synthase